MENTMNKYTLNQYNKLKEPFREHPYFKLCMTVFNIFQELQPTMVITPVQLFVDASLVLDSILINRDLSEELCQSLWTDKYNEYRDHDGTAGDKDDTKAEVAMLFYMVMYGLTTVNQSFYCGKLTRILHESIHKFYGRKECLYIEKKLHETVNQHSEEMREWMEEYYRNKGDLTKEIKEVFTSPKSVKPKKPSKNDIKTPYVLKYICKDETTRNNRLQRVMILMQNWNWIEEPRDADDFFDFFSGEPRFCNLKWTGPNTTILSLLIKKLYEQSFFYKQEGASVLAILKNQFGLKSVSYNQERVSIEDNNRISLITVILNPDVQFKKIPNKGYGDGLDYRDSVMYEVYKNELHITKDLNKYYE